MEIRIGLYEVSMIGGDKRIGTLILTKLKHPIRFYDDEVLLKLQRGEQKAEQLGRCSPHALHNALRGLGLIS